MGCTQTKVTDTADSGQLKQTKEKPTKQSKNKNGKTTDVEILEPVKPKATYANYLSSYDGKVKNESACSLRGVTFMQNGDLVVADYKNNKLKLYSSKFEFLAELELPSAPWDVCQAADNADDILATVPYKKEVHRITVSIENNKERLVPLSEFRTEGFCWGISCFDGGIATCVKVSVPEKAWPKPPEFQVHIHEFDGTYRRAIMFDANSVPYFKEPKYLNVTYDDLFLLISDYKQNTVMCMNNEDELIFSYLGMKSPNGIAMDENKNLHIASFFGAQRVHKVGPNGKYIDGLPHDEDRPLFPHGICYRRKDKIIVMTTDQSLEVYKLV
ncbi:uncharacterized protein LOC132748823 [Ruditapes philippinarum]|uniref:uncharacterized protein LOC132748823 n=1 Tax=Ruditapes philippinarum TaxID=129788 RepID=UPI00295BDD59|nr:uncharacterized protein LOC132748823 [Ruditapes philippinarum]